MNKNKNAETCKCQLAPCQLGKHDLCSAGCTPDSVAGLGECEHELKKFEMNCFKCGKAVGKTQEPVNPVFNGGKPFSGWICPDCGKRAFLDGYCKDHKPEKAEETPEIETVKTEEVCPHVPENRPLGATTCLACYYKKQSQPEQPSKESWEEAFDDNFLVVGHDYLLNSTHKPTGTEVAKKLKSFISSEIDRAREDEKKRCAGIVGKEMKYCNQIHHPHCSAFYEVEELANKILNTL